MVASGDPRPEPGPPQALHLFHGVLATPAGRAFTALRAALAAGAQLQAAAAYTRLFRLLAAQGWAGDAWRAHIAEAVVRDGNPFSLAAEAPPGLAAAAALDLALLQRLGDGAGLEAARRELGAAGIALAPCRDLGARAPAGLAARLGAAPDWRALAGELRAHALAGGAGPQAAQWAYRWAEGRGYRVRIVAVARPDLPLLSELWGYASERGLVIENTVRFLDGLPAQDVLLYGDRGTGKSSTVRALLREFGGRGLRLVELGRRSLPRLPEVWAALDGRPQRFIIFVDDLSFEEDETEYKDAKAALQGGLRGRPPNVLVYATSNRRHLVRERVSERGAAEPAADDPRGADAVQEKLSLADRFGLTVVFAAPDQRLYVEIAQHLAAARGLDVPAAELQARALRWELWHNGRSGRSARQFVDGLEAELRSAARAR